MTRRPRIWWATVSRYMTWIGITKRLAQCFGSTIFVPKCVFPFFRKHLYRVTDKGAGFCDVEVCPADNWGSWSPFKSDYRDSEIEQAFADVKPSREIAA